MKIARRQFVATGVAAAAVLPDITKARDILKWEPKVERKEGLKSTYEYFKSLPPAEWLRQPKEFSSRK